MQHGAVIGFLVVFGLCFCVTLAYAQVRTSSNFSIEADSINVAGGLGTSTNFTQESTMGEVATGGSASANYRLRAGYQQMLQAYLSLSGGGDVTLTPSIGGMTGGESNGNTSFIATTDGRAGYQLTVAAAEAPAMRSLADTIPNYVPVGSVPDATFITDLTDAHFGFTASGADTASDFLVSGATCGAGVSSSTACWQGLTTSATVVATRASANHPFGSTSTLSFKVGIGTMVNQPPGTYVATTTVTLLSL